MVGILSFLFGKKKAQVPSIPTVKMRQEFRGAFDESFHLHVSQLGCFSDDEIQEMALFIRNVPSGLPNRGAWHCPIYDKYFKQREWHAPSFEVHNAENVPEWEPFVKVCKNFKVAEKKKILLKLDIHFDKKAKNSELFDILITNISEEVLVSTFPHYIENLLEAKENNKKCIYADLIHQIWRYAQSLDTVQMAKKYDQQYELIFFDNHDEEKAKNILLKNPNALPPFFPNDRTVVKLSLSK